MSRVSLDAGLPNIVGNATGLCVYPSHATSGSLGYGTPATFGVGGGIVYNIVELSLDASRSSSIYGSSDTVTPLSLSCKFIISY